ncbi:cholecystokinin receptor type A-like [Mya arenaria]|uniref:cholecystokinin receptor type A-like n=1 Tax=Mya arenaria TaxID=6604 RepID=UPI0022E3E78E|nr:cholecystokinin receptor type A-like [Mya arenaria]
MESPDDLNVRYATAILPLTVTFGLFAVIGVAGNIIVLLVFSLGRAYRHNNFRVFVLCLGTIDLLTSAFLIPAEMAKHRNYFSFESLALCKTKCLFNVWAGCAAALSLLVISIDRYRKVCRPFKKQITPPLAMKLCVFLSFFLSIILSVPGAVMCGIKETKKENIYGNMTTVYLCETEEKYEKHILRSIYKLTFIVLLVGVSVACIIMYILIGKQIYAHWGTMPVSFRKDSTKEYNSDYSSDTFGHLKSAGSSGKASDQVEKASTDTKSSDLDPPPSPIVRNPLTRSESNGSARKSRPPLVKQATIEENGQEKAQKKLIKQLSTISDEAAARRRKMSRNTSGFGIRRFPYKTLIWFILTLVFIITYIMYIVLATKVPGLIKMEPTSFAIFQSFFRLYFLNNIINPIVYAALDKNFRDACRTIGPRLKARFRECC